MPINQLNNGDSGLIARTIINELVASVQGGSITGSFTGSFVGDGSGLTNVPSPFLLNQTDNISTVKNYENIINHGDLLIPLNCTFIIEENAQYLILGELINNGNIIVSGSLIANQGITGPGSIEGPGTILNNDIIVTFDKANQPYGFPQLDGDGNLTLTGSFATTGPNSFDGNQTITGSIDMTGNITFTEPGTFISQTSISSSIYISALNGGLLQLNRDGGEGDIIMLNGGNKVVINGNMITTGSVDITGSLTVNGSTAVRPYKVYTALVSQTGTSHLTSITSGTLTVGTTYQITSYQTGDDFTNVGAPNNNTGTYFVATGGDYDTPVTPNVWTEGSELTSDDGAPTVNILENTLGNNVNPYYLYSATGIYSINSNVGSPFVVGKTALFIGSVGDDYASPSYGFLRINSGDILTILTQGASSTNANDMLLNTSIEIRVYN